VVSQRLIPTVDSKRRAAVEVLVRTPTIEKLIMENRDYEIRDVIEKGREHYKSQSFDQSILDLYNEGVISKEMALEHATSAADLELRMSGLTAGKLSEQNGDTKNGAIRLESRDDIFDLK